MNKRIRKLRRRAEEFLNAPGKELSRWARFVRFQIQLWRNCARRLRENNATAMSAALSFRTIFALVPVLVLSLLVLKSLGMLEDGKKNLREFLEAGGIAQISQVRSEETQAEATTQPQTQQGTQPATGPSTRPAARSRVVNLANQLERLVERVDRRLTFGSIGPVGIAVLILAALTLLTTMERSLNRIFGAPRSRSLGRRILLYWSVVTLGPVLYGGALYGASVVTAAAMDVPVVRWIVAGTSWLGPLIVGVVLLGGLYKLMPNTRVSYRAAVGGAVIAVPLWMLARWAFGVYVVGVGQQSLYGALGLLPLFLIWLNVSWLIFLFGAELSHTATNLSRIQAAERARQTLIGASDGLAVALAVAVPFQAGKGQADLDDIARQVRLPDHSLHQLLDRLTERGFVRPVDPGKEDEDAVTAWLPARPLERVGVLELLELSGPADDLGRYGSQAKALLEKLESRAAGALKDLTLADLITPEEGGQTTDR